MPWFSSEVLSTSNCESSRNENVLSGEDNPGREHGIGVFERLVSLRRGRGIRRRYNVRRCGRSSSPITRTRIQSENGVTKPFADFLFFRFWVLSVVLNYWLNFNASVNSILLAKWCRKAWNVSDLLSSFFWRKRVHALLITLLLYGYILFPTALLIRILYIFSKFLNLLLEHRYTFLFCLLHNAV